MPEHRGAEDRSGATLPWDVTHLEGGPSAARCGGSRLGPSRQARLTLSQLCSSICFQSRVKNAGTSTCQKSFKHSPAVSLQPYTHWSTHTQQILPVSAVQTCHHTASRGWLNRTLFYTHIPLFCPGEERSLRRLCLLTLTQTEPPPRDLRSHVIGWGVPQTQAWQRGVLVVLPVIGFFKSSVTPTQVSIKGHHHTPYIKDGQSHRHATHKLKTSGH